MNAIYSSDEKEIFNNALLQLVRINKTNTMKKVLQKLTYGHYILTALKSGEELESRQEDYIAAGTLNWASQVSFDPPMLAIAVGQKSDLNETINYSGKFTLHLISTDNSDMVSAFGSKSEINEDQINGFKYSKVDNQVILDDTSGYITCEVTDYKHVGDHFLYFGKVISGALNDSEKDLLTSKDIPVEYDENVAAI
jgi:flavin reductase (DIM6/NTAB) family NADH-FMN oxidoreductase RutF